MRLYQLFVNNYGDGRFGLLNIVAFVIALVVALVLHELAHGLVALWNGDNTAKMYGRLTLNPLRHFDWIGLLMMLFVGFGWAKPVPVNPNNFKNRKLGAVTVSIAGILTNLIIAFFAAIGVALIGPKILTVIYNRDYFVYFCYILLATLLSLNVSFALFNILPLFPLDGYRLLSSFVNENKRGMVFLRRYSIYIMLALIALDYIFAYLPYVAGYSPLELYIGTFGGWIQEGFVKFWGLIFHV